MSLSVDKALRQAQSHLKVGELAEAEELYKQILSKFPKNKKAIQGYQKLKAGITSKGSLNAEPPQEHIDELTSLYNQGQFEEVVLRATPMSKLFPKVSILFNLLGSSNMALLNYDEAVENYNSALKIQPKNADYLFNMGNALTGKGDITSAINFYEKVLKIKPNDSDSYYKIGMNLQQNGLLDEAIKNYKQALRLKPDFVEAYINMGNILTEKGELDAAIKSYKQALKIKPYYAEAHYNMGIALHKNGDLENSIDSYKQALKINPNHAPFYFNLGITLEKKGQFDAAIENYNKAINIKPDYAEAYNNMGNALMGKGKLDAAIESYERAFKIKPDYADAFLNTGNALICIGDLNAALKNFNNALRIRPDFREAKFQKSTILLNRHEFKLGWQLYKTNWNSKLEKTGVTTERAARWTGSSLQGKNIQVYTAQGVGDEILFSSCLPDLIKKSPNRIYLECDHRLQSLFTRSFPDIITYGTERTHQLAEISKKSDISIIDNHLDYSISIDGLPHFFRNQIEDFPKRNAFLVPDPELSNKWSKRLENLGEGVKIGISWLGGKKEVRKKNSIPLYYWKNLLSINALFINLQYGDTCEEVAQFSAKNKIKIYDWKDNNPSLDLDSQAALISELDLVISVDNATVHLCVGLGTEVWDIIDPSLNLMWMENGTNASPLSTKLQLFKKESYGSWCAVLNLVEEKLKKRIGFYDKK